MRHLRVSSPPSTFSGREREWALQLADAINGLPAFSIFSGNPNTSGVTANAGTLGFNIASATTQRLWINTSGATNSWSTVLYG